MEARNLVPFGAWGQDSTRYPSISSLLDVMEPYMRRIQLRTSSMVLAVSIAFGVCLVLILLMLWYHGKTKIPRVAVTSPLEALLAFVTPTRSHWPSHYINVAQDASSSDSKIISLSLSSLVNDVIAGNMELRNAKDLSDLFLDSLGKGTFRIRLHIEWSWWFRVGLRSFTQRLTVCKRKVSLSSNGLGLS